jgi:hypothetical protein
MILLKLRLDDHSSEDFGWRGNIGIELSKWCQENGLIRDRDYDWALMPGDNEIHFKFYGEDQSFTSMFALKWGKYL